MHIVGVIECGTDDTDQGDAAGGVCGVRMAGVHCVGAAHHGTLL